MHSPLAMLRGCLSELTLSLLLLQGITPELVPQIKPKGSSTVVKEGSPVTPIPQLFTGAAGMDMPNDFNLWWRLVMCLSLMCLSNKLVDCWL